ncbi:MAG: ABC transporter permease [Gemmatimonadota bacterium]|jgi:predicted permease
MKGEVPGWGLLLLRACSLLVPRDRRAEWLEEWMGELEALRPPGLRARREGYPGRVAFLAGAFPHALWTRREEWTLDSIGQDIRYGLRILRRGPGFSIVAILTLALGIGANGAIFSLVNGLLLRPVPGAVEPEELVQLARSYDTAPRWDNFSWPAFDLIGREAGLLEGVAGFSGSNFLVGRGENTEPVQGEYVSGGYFNLLGLVPAQGRLLGPMDEVAPGAHTVVVLSHGFWQRRFAGDPGAIGRVLHIGSVPYEIVGVAPEGFVGVDALGSPPEIWISALQRPGSTDYDTFSQWGSSWLYVFGRLGPGVDYRSAEASMEGVSQSLRNAWEGHEDIRVLMARGLGLTPEERAEGRELTLLLGGIAFLVLVLTCANVGNLFLARSMGRELEMGLRQALGAGRVRLARQVLTESVVLALGAVLVTAPLLAWGGGSLNALLPMSLRVSLAPDVRVYVFLVGVAVGAGMLFGFVPALGLVRKDLAHTLREGGSSGGRRNSLLRDGLVVGQLAISLGLISGAALLGKSVLNANRADPGFNPDNLIVGFIDLDATGRHEGEEVVRFQERLLEELERMPGVIGATLAGQAPILGGHARSTVADADRPDDPAGRYEAEHIVVTPGYFETMGIPLLQGRVLRSPAEEPEPVVVVNEALARRFWPGENAVGKTLIRRDVRMRVVGVVGDVQMRSLRAPANPGVYYPFHQEIDPYVVVQARVQGPPAAIMPALKAAAASIDPEVPLTRVTELRSGLSRSMSETRTFGLVVAVFAGLALILSIVGLYGLVSYRVAQRRREMGIRMALGAPNRDLVGLVLTRGLALSGMGLLLGLGVALGIGRTLEGILYGVGSSNLPTLAGCGVLLLLAGTVAAWIPAQRASRVNAAVSLRD